METYMLLGHASHLQRIATRVCQARRNKCVATTSSTYSHTIISATNTGGKKQTVGKAQMIKPAQSHKSLLRLHSNTGFVI